MSARDPESRGTGPHRPAGAPSGRAAFGVLALLVLASGIVTAAGAPPESTSPPPVHHGSVREEPGFVPMVDPESMSVVLGRRTNAPLVSRPFTGGARSLEDLGRRICRALDMNRADSIRTLCVTDTEFRDILWREFPQSRPATGLTWVDAWRILFARLNGGSVAAINDYGGQPYAFQRFEGESLAIFRNFKLHNHLILVVKDPAGEIQRWNWVRSVAERKGVFKIYSMRD